MFLWNNKNVRRISLETLLRVNHIIRVVTIPVIASVVYKILNKIHIKKQYSNIKFIRYA